MMKKLRRRYGHTKTRLDLILDSVAAKKNEVTIDTDGFTQAQVDQIIATAKARGLSASYDGRFVLVRDLGGMSQYGHAAKKSGRKVFHVPGLGVDFSAGGGPTTIHRDHVDLKQAGDYGADPIGDGTFRMVPSGDIVDYAERNRRLARFQVRR
jgi:hypothetical protein